MVEPYLPKCLVAIVYDYCQPWREAGTNGPIRTLSRLTRYGWDYRLRCNSYISVIDGLMDQWVWGYERAHYKGLLGRYVTIILAICAVNPIDYKTFVSRYHDSILKGGHRNVIREHLHAMRQATRKCR